MDEFERESGITEEFADKRKKKEKKPPNKVLKAIGRVFAILITIVLVVGAVWFVANWEDISIDAIRRSIAYRTGDSTVAHQIIYSGDANGSFVSLGDGLLGCSEKELQLYDKGGEAVIDQLIDFDKPVICVEGGYAVVFDAGGSQLYLIHNERIEWNYSTTKGQRLLSARVNADGYLTIVEQATGYKAAVTVYNADRKALLTENISSSFITDAILSPDKKTLALVSIGEDATGFDSTIIFYNVSDGAERSRCVLGDDVVLDLQWEKDGLWVAGEYGAYCVVDAEIVASYTDAGWYLKGFALGGDGFAALFYSKYQGGSTGSLTVLYEDGSVGSLGLTEEVLSVSASGNYLAILTSSQLTVYRPDLTVYAQAENTWGARRILMRDDGSALVVSTESANLFLPE